MSNKFTLIADSTQLAAFGECPEMWNLAHQERLEKKDQNRKAMNMGSYGHTLLERYYKSRASGQNQAQGLEFALSVPPEEYLQLTIEEATLLRDKIAVYAYTYTNNDFIPRDPESVELGFSRKVYEDDSRVFILEGKLDKYQHTPSLGTYNGMTSIMDHKFQMRRHDLYEKRLQFRNYAWATNSNLFVINYIRMTKKNDEGTFVRKTVPFSSLELQLWEQRLIGMFKKMEVAIRLANGEYGKAEGFEHRWSSCENKYGYACQFTDICEQTDQFSLNMVKEMKYVKIQEWKPW
jgi:PD-(D/E)XK nuclease superfamily protein